MLIAAGSLNLQSKRGRIPAIALAGDYQLPPLELLLHKAEERFQQQLQSLLRVEPRKHENIRGVTQGWMQLAEEVGVLADLEMFCFNSKRDDDPAGKLQRVF